MNDWQEEHIIGHDIRACWHCARPTRFIHVDFHAPLHPGSCTERKWDEYDRANAALPPARISWPGDASGF